MISDVNHIPENNEDDFIFDVNRSPDIIEDDFIFDVNRSPDIINEIVNPRQCFSDEDALTNDASSPDIPWDDMEEICVNAPCQNLLVNEAGFDEYERDKFDDDFDNESSLSTNCVGIDDKSCDNDPDTSKNEIVSEANTKAPKYVDNGTSPMLVAERFIKENSIFKLNSRLYLYNLDSKPCYTEVSDETLCEVLFEQYKALFMREQPGLALQVCRSIRLQLKGIPKEAIIKYEARYIAVRNAIIDLKKDRVINHTPKILLRYYLDLDVDLDNSYCPTFISFIKDAASEKGKVVKSIYEMLAYLIFLTEFRKAIFCIIGPPNSGKSIISGLLQSLFSNGCVSNESLCDLGKNFRSGNYAEARLNIDGDLPNKVIGEKEIGILKRISGGDRIVS